MDTNTPRNCVSKVAWKTALAGVRAPFLRQIYGTSTLIAYVFINSSLGLFDTSHGQSTRCGARTPNMQPIAFITSNRGKVKSLKKWLKPYGLVVKAQSPLATQPERKQETIEKTALFKVLDHKAQASCPFIVQDGGFFLDAYPGFPGPYVNHILGTLGIRGILDMVPNGNRSCSFRDALAFWSPALEQLDPQNPVRLFVSEIHGSVASQPSRGRNAEAWSDLWTIFVPEGFTSTLAAMDSHELLQFELLQDKREHNCFVAFAEWITHHQEYLHKQKSLIDLIEEQEEAMERTVEPKRRSQRPR